jgi:hypothetical protein
MSCRRIDESHPYGSMRVHPHPEAQIMPGWFCCSCRNYNGYQREACKICRHPACFPCTEGEELPIACIVPAGSVPLAGHNLLGQGIAFTTVKAKATRNVP